MAFLTDRTLATGVTLQDLIHIVITGDTSQGNPAGSSYKAKIGQLSPLFSGTTFTGGTVIGGTNFINGLTANTISAATYLNLPVTADTNFANTNLTLDNNRIHNLNGYDLFFSEDGNLFTYTFFGIFGDSGGNGYFRASKSGDVVLDIDNAEFKVYGFNIGTNRLSINVSETVFNDGGQDKDFRIEGDSDQNLFFVDASTDKVGIGTTTPSEKLDVSGKTKTVNFQMTSGATPGYILTSDANGNGSWQTPSLLKYYSTTGITTSQSITWDKTYWGISGTTNVDLTLPSTVSKDGYILIIKDEAGISGLNRIRLTPIAGTIDGNPFVDMNINYMSLTIMARNNNWWII